MSKDYSKKSSFQNPDAPATRKQTWTLFCLTKQDWRDKNLTVFEASQLIGKIKNGEEVTAPEGTVKLRKKQDASKILAEAEAAGEQAGKAVVPAPMVVEQHVDMTDDNSPVAQAWLVPDGVCGFAWIVVKCTNTASRSFINQLKKAGLATSDVNERGGAVFRPHYHGGFAMYVHYGNQSYERKTAYASAFAEVLCKYGINAYSGSRLD